MSDAAPATTETVTATSVPASSNNQRGFLGRAFHKAVTGFVIAANLVTLVSGFQLTQKEYAANPAKDPTLVDVVEDASTGPVGLLREWVEAKEPVTLYGRLTRFIDEETQKADFTGAKAVSTTANSLLTIAGAPCAAIGAGASGAWKSWRRETPAAVQASPPAPAAPATAPNPQ